VIAKKPDSFLMQNMLICGFAKKHVWLKNFLVIWNMIASLGSL
jgi:hypothetical protein